jgi:tetratricopeptide (TPR) repeat protein/DNA-binding CsgD family transcriptional regulator/DNA-binding XRE family transcriptional regulator
MDESRKLLFAEHLRHVRGYRGWSQDQLAAFLGTNANTVSRWERGTMLPSITLQTRLTTLLGLSRSDLGLSSAKAKEPTDSLVEQSASTSPPLWQVPFRRNPFFTGREAVLAQLHQQLCRPGSVEALTGMGGLGKSHLALEYAYRFRTSYQAIFWLQAETRDLFLADLGLVIERLGLIQPTEHNLQQILAAWQQWLHTHTNWLVIVDNVEDLSTLADLLPKPVTGALLLTARSPVMGTLAQTVELSPMDQEVGALFLLRRAKRLAPGSRLRDATSALQTQARQIVDVLEGLPLALDQAGAYLEETACNLEDYVVRYQTERRALLSRRGGIQADHPASVSATLALALAQVEATHPEAAELLRFSAFLQADAIPEDLLTAGAAELSPSLAQVVSQPSTLDAAVLTLRQAALLQRQPEERMLNLHRLVQAILRDQCSENEQHQWLEQAIRVVNQAFPDSSDETRWAVCQRYLPQAHACAKWIETWQLHAPASGELLTKLGAYLQEQGMYQQAGLYLQQALTILGATVGEQHPLTAKGYNELGLLRHYQGDVVQAEQYYRQALVIREACFEASHLEILESLANLGGLAFSQGHYAEAEELWQRVLDLHLSAQREHHPKTGLVLHNLGGAADVQGKLAEAEDLFRRALAIRQETMGATHLLTALTMRCLADVVRRQKKYAAAQALHEQVLAIREQALDPDNSHVAASLHDLARVAHDQSEYERAEALYAQALSIRQKALGPTHPRTLDSLQHVAKLHLEQGHDEQALAYAQEVLTLREQSLGGGHPEVAETLAFLATVAACHGAAVEAEQLFGRAHTIWERAFGPVVGERETEWRHYAKDLCARRRTAHGGVAQASSTKSRDGKSALRVTTSGTLFVAGERTVPVLTGRERDLLTLRGAGYSNKQIAEVLILAESTVKWHLKILYGKLHVHSRTQAIACMQSEQLAAVENDADER